MKSKFLVITIILSTFLFSLLSAQDPSKRIIVEKSIKNKGVDYIKAEIEMVIGSINLSCKDISHLVQVECVFYNEIWEPKFEYNVSDNTGKLHISNRDAVTDNNYDDDDQSKWNLVINDAIPIELNIYLGAGDANIDLEACNIKKLDYEMKAGACEMNLKNTSVPLLNVNAIVGEATIDLSGRWKNDLNAIIKGGVGDLTLILPEDYSIELRISGVIGEIEARGFNKKGKYYYRNSDNNKETLYFDIQGGIGNVLIQLAD